MVIHLQGRVWGGRRWVEVPFEELVQNHWTVGEGRAYNDASRGYFDKLDVAAIVSEIKFHLESPGKFPRWVLIQDHLGMRCYWESVFRDIKSVGWVNNDGSMGLKGRAFVEGFAAGLERYLAEKRKEGDKR